MPSPFANAVASPGTGGMPYATSVPLTTTEADLFNQNSPPFYDPVPVPSEHEAVLAIVKLTLPVNLQSNTTYIVLQTDLGDGVWVDVSWLLWTGITGTATFAMSGGASGSRVVQQTRAAGTAPGSSNTNNLPLGGRIRFVGKATFTGSASSSSSSSSSSGAVAQVQATIKYLFLKTWGGGSN